MDAKQPTNVIHGVNLSGWLVLEPWITPSLFASTGALDAPDLAVALGPKKYTKLIEKHRKTFITERDFLQMASRGYNAVRLPVPWRMLQDAAYASSQETLSTLDYVEKAFAWGERYGIKILIDVVVDPAAEARPEEQEDYVSATSRLREPLIAMMGEIAAKFAGKSALLGIEPLNDPVAQRRAGLTVTKGIPLHVLRIFYRDCYEAIREAAGVGPTVVLGAAGRPNEWRSFMAQRRYKNVWLDLHLFQYTANLDSAAPSAIRGLVRKSKEELERAKRSGLPILVGEWSSALPVAAASLTPEGRIAMERVYAGAQIQAYAKGVGWFFQTWKTESKLSAWDARLALSSFQRGMFD